MSEYGVPMPMQHQFPPGCYVPSVPQRAMWPVEVVYYPLAVGQQKFIANHCDWHTLGGPVWVKASTAEVEVSEVYPPPDKPGKIPKDIWVKYPSTIYVHNTGSANATISYRYSDPS